MGGGACCGRLGLEQGLALGAGVSQRQRGRSTVIASLCRIALSHRFVAFFFCFSSDSWASAAVREDSATNRGHRQRPGRLRSARMTQRRKLAACVCGLGVYGFTDRGLRPRPWRPRSAQTTRTQTLAACTPSWPAWRAFVCLGQARGVGTPLHLRRDSLPPSHLRRSICRVGPPREKPLTSTARSTTQQPRRNLSLPPLPHASAVARCTHTS